MEICPMKRALRIRRFLALVFAAACACALWVTFWMPSLNVAPASEGGCCCESKHAGEDTARPTLTLQRVGRAIHSRLRPSLARAVPGPADAALRGGGRLARGDEAGGVTALAPDGGVRWRTAFSNQVFEAAAAVSDG
jgi:hypothetical protein